MNIPDDYNTRSYGNRLRYCVEVLVCQSCYRRYYFVLSKLNRKYPNKRDKQDTWNYGR